MRRMNPPTGIARQPDAPLWHRVLMHQHFAPANDNIQWRNARSVAGQFLGCVAVAVLVWLALVMT